MTSLRSHAELGDEERTLKELTVINAERPFIAAAELDGPRRVLRTGRRRPADGLGEIPQPKTEVSHVPGGRPRKYL